MKIKTLALAAALASAVPAFAAVAPASSGDGELFLSVYDNVAKVSYTLDLGLRLDAFITTGTQATGYAQNWSLAGDGSFTDFLAAADASNLKWSVLAGDSTGNNQPDAQRLLTTLAANQTVADIKKTNNQRLTNGIAALNVFTGALNSTGTHGTPQNFSDYTVNGSSFNADPSNAYFGKSGGATPTLNGQAQFNNGNAVGADSSFFYLTRSSTSQGAFVRATQFENAAGAGMFSFTNTNGDYALSYNIAAVPEPETYALMVAGLLAVGTIAPRRKSA